MLAVAKLGLRKHGLFDGEELRKGEVGGVANCFRLTFRDVGVEWIDCMGFSSPEVVEFFVDLSFRRDEDLFTTDLVISWSCRADFDLELKEAEDLGVKKRLNRFGVIGGGFRSFVDFRDLGEAVGTTGGEEAIGSVILCTGLPSLVTLWDSRPGIMDNVAPGFGYEVDDADWLEYEGQQISKCKQRSINMPIRSKRSKTW